MDYYTTALIWLILGFCFGVLLYEFFNGPPPPRF